MRLAVFVIVLALAAPSGLVGWMGARYWDTRIVEPREALVLAIMVMLLVLAAVGLT